MTTKESAKLIGRKGTIETRGGLIVTVTVKDVRSVFGRTEVQVSPLDGSGETWVNLDSVTLSNPAK